MRSFFVGALALLRLHAGVAQCPFLEGQTTEPGAPCPFTGKNATGAPPLKLATDVTGDGCTCTSTCGPTVDDFSTCDWCYTTEECGAWTLGFGYWDYCVYPSMDAYEALDHTSKLNLIWAKVTDPDVVGQTDAPISAPFKKNGGMED